MKPTPFIQSSTEQMELATVASEFDTVNVSRLHIFDNVKNMVSEACDVGKIPCGYNKMRLFKIV